MKGSLRYKKGEVPPLCFGDVEVIADMINIYESCLPPYTDEITQLTPRLP